MTPEINHPAANTAAVITLDADADQIRVVDSVDWSFDRATNKITSLTITIDGVTKYKTDIAAGWSGHDTYEPPRALYGNKNEAVVITLAADDGGAVGKVNAATR
jgi:hypothetical protein